MLEGFNLEKIKSVEFIACIENEDDSDQYFVPVDKEAQKLFELTLLDTIKQLKFEIDTWDNFELSQKYEKKERLIISTDQSEMSKINEIFNSEGWQENTKILEDLSSMVFYYCVFRDNKKNKIIGVRKATVFKRTLKQKGRFIKLVDNTFEVLNEDLFTIDKDFDFIITSKNVYILRPSSFEFVADLENIVMEKAKEKTLGLGERISCVEFTDLAEFVSGKKRAARIISGLQVRNDLEKITKERLIEAAHNTGVEIEEVGEDKIKPKTGSEMNFLELLDHRRYTTTLTDEDPLAFRAGNRTLIKKPT